MPGGAILFRHTVALFLCAAIVSACTTPETTAPAMARPQRVTLAGRSRDTLAPPDLEPHYRYILASQRSTGAIAMTPGQGGVNPYFANLAARALLTRPGHLEAVQRYMDWYLAHLNPDGTMDDYVVRDGRESATGDADSTDSYAATFLTLVAAWTEAGGDAAWLHKNRPGLEAVAGAIGAVTDDDGLTWAKPGYGHKLLMDNCEVYRGWADWSRLLQNQGDQLGAVAARSRAGRVLAALPRFRQPGGVWGWAIDRKGRLIQSDAAEFYPDAVAQVFPLIWGLTDDPGGYAALDANQPAWRSLQVGDFPWLLPAYAAARAGDAAAVRQTLQAVTARHPDLRWPWFVAESAWLLQAWAAIH